MSTSTAIIGLGIAILLPAIIYLIREYGKNPIETNTNTSASSAYPTDRQERKRLERNERQNIKYRTALAPLIAADNGCHNCKHLSPSCAGSYCDGNSVVSKIEGVCLGWTQRAK